MSDAAIDHCRACVTRISTAWAAAGMKFTMKVHALAEHLCDQMAFAGNATWTHNYADESYNAQASGPHRQPIMEQLLRGGSGGGWRGGGRRSRRGRSFFDINDQRPLRRRRARRRRSSSINSSRRSSKSSSNSIIKIDISSRAPLRGS